VTAHSDAALDPDHSPAPGVLLNGIGMEEAPMVQLVVSPDFWVNRIYPEGLIENWLVPDGSAVDIEQPVAQLRIEGELITIKAPAAGKLEIDSRKNSPVEPGSVIGRIR
jgi:hypothetical protein